jgi:hypothetical protein
VRQQDLGVLARIIYDVSTASVDTLLLRVKRRAGWGLLSSDFVTNLHEYCGLGRNVGANLQIVLHTFHTLHFSSQFGCHCFSLSPLNRTSQGDRSFFGDHEDAGEASQPILSQQGLYVRGNHTVPRAVRQRSISGG